MHIWDNGVGEGYQVYMLVCANGVPILDKYIDKNIFGAF